MTTALTLTLSGVALIVIASLAHAREASRERDRFKLRGDRLWLDNQQLERDLADSRARLRAMMRRDLERAFGSN